MVPLPPLRDGGCALPICPFGRACLPLISDAPDCKCSPGRLWFLGGVGEMPESRCTDFNPRAPCGARRYTGGATESSLLFQSTRPVWGATFNGLLCFQYNAGISIHAPRVGRDDLFDFLGLRGFKHFNPRAPCGARPHLTIAKFACLIFQSTRPVWGATIVKHHTRHVIAISIHAPRVGRDCAILLGEE